MNPEDPAHGPDRLTVAPAELRTAAQAVKNLLTNVSTGWGSLHSDVTKLLIGWKGPAGSSFADAWEELHQGVTDLVDDIAKIQSSLNQSAQAYLDQDGAGAKALESVRSTLNL
jgi:WXG100 family type VII secretion target